jgi:hypothetical protein
MFVGKAMLSFSGENMGSKLCDILNFLSVFWPATQYFKKSYTQRNWSEFMICANRKRQGTFLLGLFRV